MLKSPTSRPAYSLTSIVRALWKKRVVIAFIWASIGLTTAVVVARMPPRYRAESLVLVESQKIPENYVAATVHVQLSERLDRLKQEVLSYDRLLSLINQYDLYPGSRGKAPDVEIVRDMRDDIGITLERTWSAERPGAFRVTYMGGQPQSTAAVVNQISRFFVDENRRGRQAQADGTSEFLESQLAQSKRNLEAQESRLRQYKLTYNGELPQQEGALIASIGQGKAELQGIQQEFSRVQQTKVMLQNSLMGLSEIIRLREEVARQRTVVARVDNEPADRIPERASDRLRANLDALRLRYGNRHPEVERISAELATAENAERKSAKQAEAAPRQPRAETRPAEDFNAATSLERERINEINAQLAAADKEISDLREREQRVVALNHDLEQRLTKLPIREQQLATVLRDYDISKVAYQALLEKKLAADVASNMEKRHQAERFTVLEEARVPEKPVRPRKTMLTVGGCVLGLLTGLIAAFALELKAGVLLGEWELPPDAPVLARVPRIAAGA